MAARFCVGTPMSSTAAWAATSGGASGVSVPTAADDVKLDANSPASTLDSTMSCLTFDCTGYTHVLTHAAAATLTIAGTTFTLVSGMTYTLVNAATSALAFSAASGTVTITTGGKTLGNVTTASGLTVSSATYTLGDANTIGATATWTHNAGTLSTNNQTVSWGSFNTNNGNAITLTFGSSAIALTGTSVVWLSANARAITFTANTAVITLTGAAALFQDGGHNLNGASVVMQVAGAAQFGFSGTTTMANFTYTGPAGVCSLAFFSNLTVTGTLTITANAGSAIYRPLVCSSLLAAVGTTRTITAASLVCTGVIDFMDITGAGAATWTTAASGATLFGDCGGNSGITFTTPATQTWNGNTTGNWSTAANWTSRVPLPQDNVSINALTSGFITIDMPRAGASISCVGSTGGIVGNTSNGSSMIFGSLTCVAAMNFNNFGQVNIQFYGRGSHTLTSAGHDMGQPNQAVLFVGYGGTYTLQDSFTHAGSTAAAGLRMYAGTLNTNGQTVTVANLGVFQAIAGLSLGSSAVNLFGLGTWTPPLGTFNAGTSTINITDTSGNLKSFSGGGKTYNNLTISGGAASPVTITGANTFNTLTVGQGVLLTLPASTTTTVTNLADPGGAYGYQYLPGINSSGAYVTAPDSAALEFGGDFTIDVKVAMANWATPSTALVTKLNGGGTKGYQFYVGGSGTLILAYGNGSGLLQGASVPATGFAAGSTHWVRVSFQVNNAGNTNYSFYTSSDGVTWTQLGITVGTAGAATLVHDSSPLEIGSRILGTGLSTAGAFYEVRLYNSALGSGAGTPVFDANFATKTLGANTFTESSSNAATVTINGGIAQAGDGRAAYASSTPGTKATLAIPANQEFSQVDLATFQDLAASPILYGGSNSKIISNCSGIQLSDRPGILGMML